MKPTRGLTIALLATALYGLSTAPAEAATASLASNRTSGIAGEALRFTGSVGTKFTRPVVLVRYASGRWVTVHKGRTNSKGRFTIASTVRGTDTTYRVIAAKVKRNSRWYVKRSSANKRIRVQKQASSFVSAGRLDVGGSATLTWKFYPPRTNRPTILQRLDGTSWSTLASGQESADGHTSFTWRPSASGSVTLRAVARAHNGAVQHASPATSLDVSDKAGRLPADVLDLTPWKITLPIGSQDEPDEAIEVKQPDLATFEQAPYFHVNDAGTGVVFRAHVGGATTSGSSYPRSELREMKRGGDKADWNSSDGENVLSVTAAITHVPAKKSHVVAAQIHDDEDDIIMIRLEGKHLFVEADGDDLGTLDDDYRLGRPFTVRIRANDDGVHVSYNGTPKVDYDKHGKHWYFKAGCYTQSNPAKGDDPDDYGEVVIHDLSVSHT